MLLIFTAATFALFGGSTEEERNSAASHRAFLNACEDSGFTRANTPNTIEAARLCSCILSWHLNTSPADRRGKPPIALYLATEGQGAAVPATVAAMDEKARLACLRPN